MIMKVIKSHMTYPLLEGKKVGSIINFSCMTISNDMYYIVGTPYLINLKNINRLVDEGFLSLVKNNNTTNW